MKHTLPIILGGGIFDSKKKFGNISITVPRTVESYELEYFFEDGGLTVLNDCRYKIKRRNVIFSKPGDIRYSHLPFTCKFLHFTATDPQLISSLQGISSYFDLIEAKRVDDALSEIIALFHSASPFDNITASAKLIALLYQLGNESKQKVSISKNAQKFIEENYFNELSVENIANNCNVSVSHLHKLFKDSYGITPGEYLLNCRITAARDLLINTNQSLSEIAINCGFNSQSYFSDCFKRKTGFSPKEFRNKFEHIP